MKDIKDFENYNWKDCNGNTKPMMEMTYDEIQRAYTQVTDMLWNNEPSHLGRTFVKNNINKSIEECNIELLKRHLIYNTYIEAFKTSKDILEYVSNVKKDMNLTTDTSIKNIFTWIPKEYESITINDLMNACLDKLGCINRKMISDKFILSQGIWLTEDEKKDLTEYDEVTHERRSFMDVIKERLMLINNPHLRVDVKGFSFEEFRAIIKLPPMTKISMLPSRTLEILRDKVLPLLNVETDKRIIKWTSLMHELEEVADYKHFILKKKEY